MKEAALNFYKRGYGCSQCIFKAVESVYNIKLDPKLMNMSGAMNSGFGIGGMCSVVIACVMVLGLFYDEDRVKPIRIKFIEDVHKKYGGINCPQLISKRRGRGLCQEQVYEIAEILEKYIDSP